MRSAVLIAGLLLAALSLWQIEGKRPSGVDIDWDQVAGGQVKTWLQNEQEAIATVVVAHGFAGSRQLMNAYVWTLAQNGYDVVTFNFAGHGTHPIPMSGDTDSVAGTTRQLVDQTLKVTEYAGQGPALLGHSMATDVIIRAAAEANTGPIVAISAFSGAVTADHPRSLLMIAGEWEGRLIEFGRDAIKMVDPLATEGQRVGTEVTRMALVSPRVEHVGILYAPFALRETVRWLDSYYGVPEREIEVANIGYWVLSLLGAVMLLWWPISRAFPATGVAAAVPRRALLWCAAFSATTPVAVYWIELSVLPVLVADYLALHLGFAGIMQLLILRHFGVSFGSLAILPAAALLFWGIGIFGLAIDAYVANFHPNSQRALILAALAFGAVPFMSADAIATQGGRGPLWHRLLLRTAFFVSLGLAVALDFERLFFLFLIAPIIFLFFLIFGFMGRWTADRAGPLAPGIALGLILAWSLGVTFPLFQA